MSRDAKVTAQVNGQNLLVRRNRRTILDVPSIDVLPSEILAVVGPNGAGKSTLLRVLALLMKSDTGHVSIDGVRSVSRNENTLRRRLACVFQSPLLLDRSVFANVELGLRLRGVTKAQRKPRAQKWLDALGIAHLAEQHAHTVSGGEAQRVNLARALALQPEVLFLDEPFGGLDSPTRHTLLDQIGPLVRHGAGAGLLVTHDRRVAMALGDRVAVMLDGALRQIGSPAEVFSKPRDLEVARFVGIENIIEGRALGGTFSIGDSVDLHCKNTLRGPAHMCLRAEEIYFGDVPHHGAEWNVLNGTVTHLAPRGDGFSVTVDIGCTLIGRLTRARQSLLELEPGKTLPICIRTEAIHLIEDAAPPPSAPINTLR